MFLFTYQEGKKKVQSRWEIIETTLLNHIQNSYELEVRVIIKTVHAVHFIHNSAGLADDFNYPLGTPRSSSGCCVVSLQRVFTVLCASLRSNSHKCCNVG